VGDHSHAFGGQKPLRKAVCAGDLPRVQVLRMRWHILHGRPNLTVISVMVFRQSSPATLRTFSTFSSVLPVEGRPERSKFFDLSFPTFESTEPLKSLCSPMALSPKAILSISCVSDVVFPSVKQNFTQMSCSFRSAFHLQPKITDHT
jgi:hypothetical protein